MDTRNIVRVGAAVLIAALLLTLVFSVATAFAEEAKPAATGTTVEKSGEAAAAEGAKEGQKLHTVGNPTPEQRQDLLRAWAGIPGFDLLAVAIIGLVGTVGIVAFGAYKQAKV